MVGRSVVMVAARKRDRHADLTIGRTPLGTTLIPMAWAHRLTLCVLLSSVLAALDVPEGALVAFAGHEDQPGATAVVIAPGQAITLSEALPPGPGPWRLHRAGGGTITASLTRRTATVALLTVPHDLPSMPLAAAEPAHGATVWTIGNAAGAIALDGYPARSRGTISGTYDLPGTPVHGRGGTVVSTWQGPVWEVDAAINEGLQGGALVDDQGRLVGLVTLGVARERRLGCVVPWRVIAQALGTPIPTPAAPAITPPWLLTLALQRPQAPPAPARPERTLDDVPPYERDAWQQRWDQYWHLTQIARTDQPVPAVAIDPQAGLLLTAAGNLHGRSDGGIAIDAAGRRVPVRLRAVDLPLDLALLAAEGPLHVPAPPWSTRRLAVGAPVTVLGTLGTQTAGHVSAVGRRLAQAEISFLQLDARANFGSLGGAVLDDGGALAGLVVHLGPDQPWLMNSGVTLAVDAATATLALGDLRAGRSRDHLPVLGLGVRLDTTDDLLTVAEVFPGTGAAEAGLLPGDILLRVAERPATSRAAVARALVRVAPGSAVPVVIRRRDTTLTIPVTVRNFGA